MATQITFNVQVCAAEMPPLYDSGGRFLNSNPVLAPIFHAGEVATFPDLIAAALIAANYAH